MAAFPNTIGAGLAETDCIFESLRSSTSTLRCSCGWGRLFCVMQLLSHVLEPTRSPSNSTICRASSVEILKHSDHSSAADSQGMQISSQQSAPIAVRAARLKATVVPRSLVKFDDSAASPEGRDD
jgi:hypothetical protein